MQATYHSPLTTQHWSLSIQKRRRRRVFWGLMLVCALAYVPPLSGLFFGAWPFDTDSLAAMAPWREFARDALWQGTLPLWNPHSFCGMPFMSNGQTAVLYPPNLVYWFLPIRISLLLDTFAHNVFLACGAYALARALRLSRTASWVVAMALGLGGAVSAHLYDGHMTWHAARAYLPWQLWALLWYLRTGERRYAFAWAGFLALQIISGSPPVVIISFLLCCGLFVAWTVSHRLAARKNPKPKSRNPNSHCVLPRGWPGAMAAAFILTVALAAVYLLPLRETSRLSVHGGGLEYQDAVALSGSWRSLARLVLPDFFGGNRSQQWSILYGAHEEAAYVGLLTLILAVGAPIFARRRIVSVGDQDSSLISHPPSLPRAVPWLWALLPISALLAMGDNTPLYRWLFEYLPPLRMTRIPVRWLEIWYIAAALLAGFSFDNLIHRARTGEETSTGSVAGRRVLLIVLSALTVLLLLLLLALLINSPRSSLWMETAQWNTRDIAYTEKVGIAQSLRALAIGASLFATALTILSLRLWSGWGSSNALRKRKRIELLLVILITLDVLILFWFSAKVVPAQAIKRYVTWPPEVVQLYRPNQRWVTMINWRALNNGMTPGIDLFNGYDPLNGRRYFEFVSAAEGQRIWQDMYQPQRLPPLLRVAGVTHMLSSLGDPVEATQRHDGTAPLLLAARSGDWGLWKRLYQVSGFGFQVSGDDNSKPTTRNPRSETAWARVYLTQRVLRVPEQKQLSLLKSLVTRSFEASGRPVVVAPTAFRSVMPSPHNKNRLATAHNKVINWKRDLNTMTIQTDAPAPSVLVQTEALYPGWRAWINGRPAAVEPANFLFRAVRVPAGPSTVRVVYDTQTYRFGLFVSLCGMATVAAMVAWRIFSLRSNAIPK